ncbi:PREDICTED: centaurin-gamma-1A-like [Priapulus caudatus]|uniref:Centaurin-gamma-1A-like n=1 Tax=Priapulus caudatus TaxID=37621 RepID=A0ABM1F4F7_PRICU|nr:PREDICTED: centaurin-gamma-1A-like [Priapulus caudatus]
MSTRGHMQPFLGNSLAIRQEIQRFESVHPSIYAIYDLIEAIPDPLLQQQIREHVVCIEDSFVNSQEWTLSRSVPDLKLGIVGSLASGKSALVHRYLTGSYMQEESPEGGRFKKEVVIDGQSYLLLIRDEGGPPELQFTAWVDAVIFVFSLENEASFNGVYQYFAKMAHYRSTAEIPMILVGTQDAISENNPRVIDDSRARKLASDLKHCSYYETCATYGLNVERVFQDACAKIVQTRLSTPTNSRASTPSQSLRGYYVSSPTNNGYHSNQQSSAAGVSSNLTAVAPSGSTHNLLAAQGPMFKEPQPPRDKAASESAKDTKDLPTPSSTPTTARKNRRRSNLFTPSKKEEKEDKKTKNGSGDMMGSDVQFPSSRVTCTNGVKPLTRSGRRNT